MAEEPTGDKVYDPFIGKERDAFPGEIISSERQTVLNRRMDEARQQFRNIFEAVKGTGKFNDEELNTILRAGEVYADIQREGYLETASKNPVVLIKEVLMNCSQQTRTLERTFSDIDTRTKSFGAAYNAIKFTSNPPLTPEEITQRVLENREKNDFYGNAILQLEVSGRDATEFNTLAEIVRNLGCLTDTSPNAIRELFRSLPYRTSYLKTDSTTYTIAGIYAYNFPIPKPGFEGIKLDIKVNDYNNITQIALRANNDAWVRVAEGINTDIN